MSFDFTTVHDRRGTNSLKWDNVLPSPGSPDVIPLWVADMDFAAPPAVVEALRARVEHGLYGYTNLPPGYFESVSEWNAKRYGRTWDPKHFLLAPSVLHGLSMAIRTFTSPGDRILNLPPVYYPFFKEILHNDREVLDVPLLKKEQWEMDFDAIDAALTQAKAEGKPAKALLFCAPHNPTGRVWTKAELTTLGSLARQHDLLILSDEIHSDLVLSGAHISPLDLPEVADRTLVFTGPNKTFNLAGLHISHVVVSDDALRARMKRAIEADHYDQPNVLSLTAAWAAYREGGAWLDQLLVVLRENKAVLEQFIETLNRDWSLSPTASVVPLEATYLALVDLTSVVKKFGFDSDKDLAVFLEKTGRVKMNPGSVFRTGGENHLRFNLATPRTLLEEGLGRIRASLETRLK